MADPISGAIAAVVSYVTTASAAVAAGTATFAQVATTLAVNTAVSVGLSAVSSALFAPKVGAGGSPISFKADPSAPISGVMGRFGVGGRQLHANVWGKDNLYISFAVALSLGPIQGVDQFTANGNVVTFPGAQGLAAPVEPYKDKMYQTYRLGLPTDGALGPPTGVANGSPAMSEWTSSHTLPGFAQVFWTMQNNSKRASYESGVPAPIWTLLGMRVWDPREDSTYPGGSGSQRRDRWDTWTWNENPYLHALAWARGHHKLNADGTVDRTKRLAGVGAPDEAIDIAAFVEGANICNANTWPIAGEWTTSDDKWQVLAAMLQAGGGSPLNRGAQISCMVEAPRTSLLTLTAEDIVGPVSLNIMASRRDRPNTIVPRVRLESQRFEEVALGAVTAATYLEEDGGEPRTREVPFRYACRAKQGAELAAYALANARETLKASIPCKPHLLNLRAGDAFTVEAPELGLNGQKFVVLKRAFDPTSAIVTLDVRSETDAKHAFALGQSADAPASPSLTAVDPVPLAPDIEDWTIVVRPPEGGTQQPGLIVTGEVTNPRARTVLIEYGPSAEGPWTQAYEGPPTTEEVAINGLTPGAVYWVAISVRSLQGVPSERTVYGPYTAPGLVSGDTNGLGGTPAAELIAELRGLQGSQAEIDRAAEALLASALDDFGRVRREATERRAAVAEVTESVDQVVTDLSAEITTRTSQVVAINTSLAGVSSLATTTATNLTAETLTRQTQISAVNSSIAVVQTSLNTVASDLSAEVTARQALAASTTAGLASVNTTLTAVSNQQTVQAGLITTAQSTANGASSSATFALSALNGNEAFVAFLVDVAGRLTAQRINGVTGAIQFLSESVEFLSSSTGARTVYSNGIWTSYSADNTVRSMWGRPFGGAQALVWWTGPNSVAAGSEEKSNAYVYVSMNTVGGPRFGGSDVPTSSGGSSGYAAGRREVIGVALNADGGAWVDVVSFTLQGVPSSPEIALAYYIFDVAGGAYTQAQFRLLRGSTVLDTGPPHDFAGDGTTYVNSSIGNTDSASGSVTYTLQRRVTAGGGAAVNIEFEVVATQAI